MLSRFSPVQLFVPQSTVAHQAPLCMGFCRQQCWSGLSCPLILDLPDPGNKHSLMSQALAGRFFICVTSVQFSYSVMSNSEKSWTAAWQASLSNTNSWSFLKLMSIESVMSSNHLILCCPLPLLLSIFPSIRVFSMSQFFTSGGISIGTSASTSDLPMNIQDYFL